MNNLLSMFTQFKQNPIAILSKKFNIPQNINNPNDIIQHLLNTNQVSQQQVDNAMRMRNHPMFKGMF